MKQTRVTLPCWTLDLRHSHARLCSSPRFKCRSVFLKLWLHSIYTCTVMANCAGSAEQTSRGLWSGFARGAGWTQNCKYYTYEPTILIYFYIYIIYKCLHVLCTVHTSLHCVHIWLENAVLLSHMVRLHRCISKYVLYCVDEFVCSCVLAGLAELSSKRRFGPMWINAVVSWCLN